MTPEQVDEFWERVEDLPDAGIKTELLGLIRAAVADEREACARLVESYDPDEVWSSTEDGSWSERESAESAQPRIAARIRARKET